MMKIYLLSILLVSSLQIYSTTAVHLFYGKTSNNFVNKWTFRTCTPYHYITPIPDLDKPGLSGINFNPQTIKPGDIIYVYKIGLFFQKVHPLIPHPYILITQGDASSGYEEKYAPYLEDPKLIAWFGVHAKRAHPKFFPIPLGTTGYQPALYVNRQEIHHFFETVRTQTVKDQLVYMNFELGAHADRRLCQELFHDKPFCLKSGFCSQGKKISQTDYFKEMARCKFTLSPRGAGIDCWRTWEALLVGSIPIVKSSALNPLYKDLPVLIINDWHEINEKFLEEKYKEITSKKYHLEKLYHEYWNKRIVTVQQAFLRKYFKASNVRPEMTSIKDKDFTQQLHELNALWDKDIKELPFSYPTLLVTENKQAQQGAINPSFIEKTVVTDESL